MYKYITKLSLVFTAIALIIVGSSAVYALNTQIKVATSTTTKANANSVSTNYSVGSQQGSNQSSKSSQASTAQANAAARLSANQLRVCQKRQTVIANIMTRINTRMQNQIQLFSTIATRVETFYTKQGKTLSTYSQLVAAVNSAQTLATTNLVNVKSSSTFSCSSVNPQALITTFRTNLKTEISDLNNFKTAVKNLIVGVASANKVTVSTSAQSNVQGSN
jgi:hypothetical protein